MLAMVMMFCVVLANWDPFAVDSNDHCVAGNHDLFGPVFCW